MTGPIDRRTLMASGLAALGAATLARGAAPRRPVGRAAPVVVASANGLDAVTRAMERLREGADPLDAAIEGVGLVEADPDDRSVGYGGLPNEDGVVELDSAVMHGPTHKGGAVAALRNIMHPAAVARTVMQRTDHCLLVGEGALAFARMHGFPEVDLLTEESREIWVHWKESLSRDDDYIPPELARLAPAVRGQIGVREYGTIHCSALDTHGDLGCVTTTSGLSFKIPGRVGDSPILGAGLYLRNDVGSAGSTGRGEANLLNCSSFLVVEALGRGLAPQDAALEACERIVATNHDPRLRDERGRPNFDVKFYCLGKDGRHGGAALWAGAQMAVHDGDGARLVDCASVFDERQPG